MLFLASAPLAIAARALSSREPVDGFPSLFALTSAASERDSGGASKKISEFIKPGYIEIQIMINTYPNITERNASLIITIGMQFII